MAEVRVDFTGPLFDQGGSALGQAIIAETMKEWFRRLRLVVPARLRRRSPNWSGRLMRSAYIVFRNGGIEFGYRRPADSYWHFGKAGRWPREHDTIILNAAREQLRPAFQMAIQKVLG